VLTDPTSKLLLLLLLLLLLRCVNMVSLQDHTVVL
jgi:hypothetical protein